MKNKLHDKQQEKPGIFGFNSVPVVGSYGISRYESVMCGHCYRMQ